MPIISTFPTGSGGSGGGGGIPLAPVTGVTTLAASGKAYIKWTDPIDTVVGDATLAAWAGTLLVRKAGSMPANRRDGTVVVDNKTRDKYKSQYFCDSGLSDGTTYYYKFFPYSTTNTYADDPQNEFNVTPNPVPTDNVTGIAVKALLNGRVQICWTDPAATKVSDGVTLATWASTKVVYKTGSYPTSPEDGTLALNSTTRNAHASSPLEVSGLSNGTTYYFGFFPISTEGAVNTNTAKGVTAIPNKTKITTVPSQEGSLTYNGSAQTPSWNNYNSTQLTLSVTGQINAGIYKATFTPKADYCWSDGSTTAKEVSWSIGKAAGSLSLNKTSITLNSDKLTDTITVTRAGDGAISATSSDISIATVSINGNVITVSHVNKKSGDATITVKVAAGTNHNAPADKTCAVSAEFVPAKAELDTMSWADIRKVSDAGLASEYWAIGDVKGVQINGTVGSTAINQKVYAFILGFDHNSAREGTNHIHFQLGKTANGGNQICFVDSSYGSYNANNGSFTMNPAANSSNSKNAGGWNASHMRKTLLGSQNSPTSPGSNTFLAALPSDLRSVMKSVTKFSDNTGGGTTAASAITSTEDYLFLLSEFEVQGARTYANEAEQNYQVQYAYYKNGNSKVFYRHSATGSTALWWLRSVYAGDASSFCFVNTGGSANGDASGISRGVAPAFCV